MEKIKNIGIAMLIILLIIITGLEGFYIIKSKENNVSNDKCNDTKNVVYKGYEYYVENIDLDMPEYIEVNREAIINGGYNLLLEISSKKDLTNLKIVIEYYDENNTLVNKDEQGLGVLLVGDKYYLDSIIPQLLTIYSGKIKVSITGEEFDATNFEVKDKTKMNLKGNIVNGSNNTVKVAITGTNPYNENINYLSGYALLYSGDKLIASGYFGSNQVIGSGLPISLESYEVFTTENITYDKVEVVVNYLN